MQSIKIKHQTSHFEEHIRISLVREAIKALPDSDPLRGILQTWTQSNKALSINELIETELKLAEFAHTNQSELGKLWRLPSGSYGRIIEEDDIGNMSMSSINVLSLALKRFITLHDLSATVDVTIEDEDTK